MSRDGSVKLSERLQAIADMVTEGYSLADIGTDHAWIPVYLCQKGSIPSAIAMDVREGPLEGAARHIREAGMEDRIQVRLSDGLQKLEPGEAESVVMTGMGGSLICRILSDAGDKTGSFAELILGPQSEAYLVRTFLEEHGFTIREEKMILEDGKYYPILRAVPGTERRNSMTPEEIAFGPCLLANRDSVLYSWLIRKKETDERILKDLNDTNSESAETRRKALREEAQLLEAALKRYEM